MKKQISSSKGFTLVELLVVIGIIALLIGILMPALGAAREAGSKVKCASNLMSLGKSMLLYANDNKDQYPRTYYDGVGTSWVVDTTGKILPLDANNVGDPFAGTTGAVGTNNIPASLFLLMRVQQFSSEIFVCPSSGAEKDTFGGTGTNTVMMRGNFTYMQDNLSYSYANPYPNATAKSSGYKLKSGMSSEFAVAADKNPGVTGGANPTDNVMVAYGSAASLLKPANSNNHKRAGQNVLYGDGHVAFQNSPYCGVGNDNIYTSRTTTTGLPTETGTCQATGTSPLTADDSVMYPVDDTQ